jgi:hypothetical protein
MKYALFVNTCDKFEDCWDPFFKLFTLYWPDFEGTIYLNTEYKEYTYENLNIVAVQGALKNNIPKTERATWSECLKWAMETIEENVVLYLQEDYFFKDTVKNVKVEEFVELMYNNQNIRCIHLTDQAVKENGASSFENLNFVALKQRYRVSCQAALWHKSELLDILREHEDAWEYEEFGSMRSEILNKDYFVVNNNYVKLGESEIIPYLFTGIVQGRWLEQVVPLFEKHNINIDYNKRGFVKEAPKKPFLKRVTYRLNKIPKIYKNMREIKRLKKNKKL